MIPTRDQCLKLFDRFALPSQKRIHVEEVTRIALQLTDFLARKNISVNKSLVEAAGLLHDIDKNIPKKEGERHPDTAVRVLRELGFSEVADVVSHHSLHHILDTKMAPKTWEEKLVYLADKMVKYELIGVKARFRLWYAENLPPRAVAELDQALPLVEALEREVFEAAGIVFADLT